MTVDRFLFSQIFLGVRYHCAGYKVEGISLYALLTHFMPRSREKCGRFGNLEIANSAVRPTHASLGEEVCHHVLVGDGELVRASPHPHHQLHVDHCKEKKRIFLALLKGMCHEIYSVQVSFTPIVVISILFENPSP